MFPRNKRFDIIFLSCLGDAQKVWVRSDVSFKVT